MTQNDDGSFNVKPGERVCIKVSKTQQPFLAQISSVGAPGVDETKPDGLTRIWCFCAPTIAGTSFSYTVAYDFAKNKAGAYDPSDRYKITVAGEGGDTGRDTVLPPPPQSRPYDFEVTNP